MAKGKKEEKTQPAQLGEMKTLAPDDVNWDIGDKLFTQRPLPLKRLSVVMNEIVDVLMSENQGAILDQVMDTMSAEGNIAAKTKQAVMPVVVRTLVSMPGSLPHICALILNEDAEQHFDEHLRGRQAIAILKVFIEQNEVGALLQDFFGLMGSLQGSMATVAEEETEEETNDDSSSEKQKTEEPSEPQ